MIDEFDFNLDYVLEDETVVLRPLTSADAAHLMVFSLYEPELWKYSLITASGTDNLLRYIQSALAARSAGKEYPFIVFDKRTNQYAGCTRFYDIQLFHKTVQLGYTWYGRQFWGSGLNKHCKYLLLQFAFNQIGMERVEFRADVNNQRSIAAMKSLGCVEEGVLRGNSVTKEGTRRDSIVLSILKKEWDEKVKATLFEKLT